MTTDLIRKKTEHYTAVIFRSLALFAILYQFRLIAADMADTSFFTITLLAAFTAAAFLINYKPSGKNLHTAAALAIIVLVPWIARLFVALPRLFVFDSAGKSAIALDSALLNLDRNNFVSLFPFYWAAVTTWFAIRSRRFLRAAVIADITLLLVLYSIVRSMDIDLYRWPIVMIALFASVIFLQALALLFSIPPETRLRTGEKVSAIAVLSIMVILGGILFLGPSQKRALEKGGGLLQPKLFSFDFSQVIKLESEINMDQNDLILIVKKDNSDPYDEHTLLRRSVLSGYNRKQGFYRLEELDERTHPQKLPNRITELITPNGINEESFPITQEYFLVNFDAAAFIGMNEPVSVTPYESWDASSFRSAFLVESMVQDIDFRSLYQYELPESGAALQELSEAEYKTYTEYGNDERIREFAEEVTQGTERYGYKVRRIHDRLKYGEYRYSLKPGIAPDGDQLGWFLFGSKKGYCSYFAFAMTLMLRSVGVPARIAAGFFIDPETNTFNYYPVRSDMAHAWVEVFFPGYGWVEFDPTTENLSEDEEWRFSSGVDPQLFERLMREILENRNQLRAKEGKDQADLSPMQSMMRSALDIVRKYWLLPTLLVIALVFLYMRCGHYVASRMHSDNRKKATRLWKHCIRRIRLAGLEKKGAVPESEWAQAIDRQVQGIYALYQNAAAARFAPEYKKDDFHTMEENYVAFSAAYKQSIPLRRRLLAWLLPPFAMLPVSAAAAKKSKPKKPGGSAVLPLLLVLFFLADSQTNADEDFLLDPDEIFGNAKMAEYAENWERAIDLYRTGGQLYPDDTRFPSALGNLYFGRALYGLALEEYRKVEAIDPFDISTLSMLAYTAGYLNQSHMSVDYYEQILSLDPLNRDAIGNLGWMYYKVHRFADGEKLLNDAIDVFGEDAHFAMTLATIYASMYKYEEGQYWYKKAVSLGRAVRDREFAAVAYYNLSILETRFYQFDLSMQAVNDSLNSRKRPSGMLARGEHNMRQLELKQAIADFQDAYETDDTPLPKVSLAEVFQMAGRLEEARLYGEDSLKAEDLSWMLNYGIDPDRYKRDIHRILYETYKGLAHTEKFMTWGTPKEKVFSLFRKVSYNFKTQVHQKLYQKYSLAAADAYYAEIIDKDQSLDSYLQYYEAFNTYPHRANAYLSRAREFEAAIIPGSAASYDYEEGVLFKNKRRLEQAIAGFDPVWERDMIARSYQQPVFRGNRDTAEELFALNHGALRQAGISLPTKIELNFDSESFHRWNLRQFFSEKSLLRALKKTGFAPTKSANESARYRLNVDIGGSRERGYYASCELVDIHTAKRVLGRSFPLHTLSGASICDFTRNLGNAVFTVE